MGNKTFAAWVRGQKRLERFGLASSKFCGRSACYLPPNICSDRLIDVTLSSVSLPEGSLGEIVRRILDKGQIRRLSLSSLNLGDLDAVAFGKIAVQRSLKKLKISDLTCLGMNKLPVFLSKLVILRSVTVADHHGHMLSSIFFAIPNIPRMRKLKIYCENPHKLSFLPLILPCMPHLEVLKLRQAAMWVDMSVDMLEILINQFVPRR